MEEKIRGDLFEVIRQVMKSRQITYVDLASRLDVSEATIKRLFSDRDCKVSRLLEICDELDISITDVVDNAKRPNPEQNLFPRSVEVALANTPSLFHFYILLLDAVPVASIMKYYDLTRSDIFLYSRDLERLGLTEKEANGQIKLKTNFPVRFRHRGPLHRMLKQKNMDFLSDIMDRHENEDDILITVSRKMQKETAQLIRTELEELKRKVNKLAGQDQSLTEQEHLHTYKMCCSWGSVDFAKMLSISPHPDKGDVE